MNEIDKIRLLNELKDDQETLDLWKNYSKYREIKKGEIEYTNVEIDELISFFSEREYFKLCDKLKNLKK